MQQPTPQTKQLRQHWPEVQHLHLRLQPKWKLDAGFQNQSGKCLGHRQSGLAASRRRRNLRYIRHNVHQQTRQSYSLARHIFHRMRHSLQQARGPCLHRARGPCLARWARSVRAARIVRAPAQDEAMQGLPSHQRHALEVQAMLREATEDEVFQHVSQQECNQLGPDQQAKQRLQTNNGRCA